MSFCLGPQRSLSGICCADESFVADRLSFLRFGQSLALVVLLVTLLGPFSTRTIFSGILFHSLLLVCVLVFWL
jgi:hypothetical protein